MKKVALSLLVAGSLAFGITTEHSQASANTTEVASVQNSTYSTAYNVNVRSGAGTGHKIVTLAKKGTKVSVIGEKKVGKQLWFQVKVNGKTGWALSSLLTKKAVTTSSATPSSKVVETAKGLTGIPYRFGGTTTRGFDCSGFVQYAFMKSGKSVARDTLGQYAQTKKVSNPKPGDLVFFKNTYRPGISHVGIYIGNNKFVHAGGKKSQVVSLDNRYWKSKFHSFKRF